MKGTLLALSRIVVDTVSDLDRGEQKRKGEDDPKVIIVT